MMVYKNKCLAIVLFFYLLLINIHRVIAYNDYIVHAPIKDASCRVKPAFTMRIYQSKLAQRAYTLPIHNKDNQKKDNHDDEQNLFFKGFGWLAERIANGIGYLIDGEDDQSVQKLLPPSQASPSINKKSNKNSLLIPKKVISEKCTQKLKCCFPNKSYKALINEYVQDLFCEQESYRAEHEYKKRRIQVLHETLKNPQVVHEKFYELSQEMDAALRERKLIVDDWQLCSGTQIQQHIHQEFIAVVKETIVINAENNQNIHCKDLADTIISFADLGVMYNHVNHILQSCSILDFCWGLKDFCAGVAEGFWDVGCELIKAVDHPIESSKSFLWRNIVHPATQLGHALTKVMRALDDLGYIQFLKLIGEKELAQEKYYDFQQRIIAFDDRLQEKIKSIGDAWKVAQALGIRTVMRQATPHLLEGYATGKTLAVFGKLSNIARMQAVAAARKVVDRVRKLPAKEIVAITAEGIELPVVAESLQFLIETEKKIGSSPQLPLSDIQRKFKIAIEGVEEILPEVAIANKDRILHILQTKHMWGRLVHNEKDWDAIARLISKVLRDGLAKPYQNSPIAMVKSLEIGSEIVQVIYPKNTNSITNAWVCF